MPDQLTTSVSSRPGKRAASPPDGAVPSANPKVRRYRFGHPIGIGGMGDVSRAARLDEDGTVIDDQLAVKHLALRFLASEEAVGRFKREVRLQRRLDHSNVMPIYGRNLSATPPWFTMPLASGNLAEEITQRFIRDLPWVVDITRQILAGVAHAHDSNVVHRDLKPANVLRIGDFWKVSDFGLGKDLEGGATAYTRTDQQMGTSPYMAPEQFDDPKSVGKPADVYAVGKIVCELCTGCQPPVRAYALEGVHRELHYFVTRCCDPDPRRRYADAREALKAFDALMSADDGDPGQQVQALIRNVHEAARNEMTLAPAVSSLASHMLRFSDEEEMYLDVVPKMPREAIVAFLDVDPGGFIRMITEFDKHVDGGLPFSYCDDVARFYRTVWRLTDDLAVRELVLRRLIVMGHSHNRWFVRDVVAGLLANVRDAATAMMAVHVIENEAPAAAWHAERVLEEKPKPSIARALRSAMS